MSTPHHILAIDDAVRADWVAAHARAAEPGPFDHPSWADVWHRASGGRIVPTPCVVTFDDGVRVLVPGAQRRDAAGLWATVLRHPAGVGAGFLAPTTLDADRVRALVAALAAREPRLVWRLAPHLAGIEGIQDWFHGRLPGPCIEHDVTHEVDLGADDPLGRPAARRARRAARTAERRGVSVSRAGNRGDWNAYVALYRSTVTRWGERRSIVHPDALFDALADAARDPGTGIELWLARREARPVAGAIVVRGGERCVYWHGAADVEGLSDRAPALLMRELIEDARGRGEQVFDFNPSGGHEGVEAFKAGFGAVARPTPILRRVPRWQRAVRRFRQQARRPSEVAR